MFVKNKSPGVSKWITNCQTPTFKATNGVDSAINAAEDLVIEDLDLCDLDISSSSFRTSLSSHKTGKNVNDFGDQNPGVVSEACTQSDLYILVRVPTRVKSLPKTVSVYSQTPKMSDQSQSPYLNANRRIFSIPEEEAVNMATQTTPLHAKIEHYKGNCWTNDDEDKEEFQSTTNMICEPDYCLLPNQVPLTSERENFVSPATNPSPIRCQNQIEFKELNLKSICFKNQPNVTLENYGILITPTKMPKTDNLLVFQVDTEEAGDTKRSKHCSCFQWLRKLFHLKGQKSGLVHAKVYKTYFVKWKKYSDDMQCSCSKANCEKMHDWRRYSA